MTTFDRRLDRLEVLWAACSTCRAWPLYVAATDEEVAAAEAWPVAEGPPEPVRQVPCPRCGRLQPEPTWIGVDLSRV